MIITAIVVKQPKFGDSGKAVTSALQEFGKVLKEDHVRKLTTGPRSGRLYGSHRASAAGEYPAKRTGKLAGSVATKVSGKQLRFGEQAFYAKFLEDGTRKMGARPHVKPSVDNNIAKLAQFIDKQFRTKVFA